MAGGDGDVRIECFSVSEGRYSTHALAYKIGDELVVSIYGGDRPHVGAVSLSVPRPSLRDAYETSATSSVLTLPGHKEDVVAKDVGERLAATLNTNVVVTAGIHFDTIDEEGILTVVRLTHEIARQVAERFRCSR